MVEEDAVAGIDAVGLAVVHRNPVGIELGYRIRAARVEGGGFLLRSFLHQTIEFGGAGLVEARFLFKPEDADSLKNTQGAQRVGVGGVFGFLKTHRNVTLGGEVVDFIRLHLLDDAHQTGAIGEIAVVEEEAHSGFVAVTIEVVNAVGIE